MRRLLAVAGLLLISQSVARAQTVRGVVVDAGDRPVPGVVVLLLDSATVAPPEGAGADNVTVQLEDPGAFTVAGEHTSELGCTVTVRLIVAD